MTRRRVRFVLTNAARTTDGEAYEGFFGDETAVAPTVRLSSGIHQVLPTESITVAVFVDAQSLIPDVQLNTLTNTRRSGASCAAGSDRSAAITSQAGQSKCGVRCRQGSQPRKRRRWTESEFSWAKAPPLHLHETVSA